MHKCFACECECEGLIVGYSCVALSKETFCKVSWDSLQWNLHIYKEINFIWRFYQKDQEKKKKREKHLKLCFLKSKVWDLIGRSCNLLRWEHKVTDSVTIYTLFSWKARLKVLILFCRVIAESRIKEKWNWYGQDSGSWLSCKY